MNAKVSYVFSALHIFYKELAMSQEERFVMLSCMAASSFIQRMYELGEEYFRNLDDLNAMNTLLWYGCLEQRNLNREIWAYTRNQEYVYIMQAVGSI